MSCWRCCASCTSSPMSTGSTSRTAASDIQKELRPQQYPARLGVLGLCLSLSSVPGDRRLGRRPLRAAQDVVLVRPDLGGRDHHRPALSSAFDAVHCPRRARLWRRRDLSDRDARHAILDAREQARFRARPHPRLRAARQCHHAAVDRGLDGLADLARLLRRARASSA